MYACCKDDNWLWASCSLRRCRYTPLSTLFDFKVTANACQQPATYALLLTYASVAFLLDCCSSTRRSACNTVQTFRVVRRKVPQADAGLANLTVFLSCSKAGPAPRGVGPPDRKDGGRGAVPLLSCSPTMVCPDQLRLDQDAGAARPTQCSTSHSGSEIQQQTAPCGWA